MSNAGIKNIDYKLNIDSKKITSEETIKIPKDTVKDSTKNTKKVSSSKKSSRTTKKKSSNVNVKIDQSNNIKKEVKSKVKKPNPSELNKVNIKAFHDGKNFEAYKMLGSHIKTEKRKKGVRFTTWAPNAKEAYLVGDFNEFKIDENYKLQRIDDEGLWSIFLPQISSGTKYKYCFIDQLDKQLEFKSDPYAIQSELRPNTASIVYELNKYKWNDKKWINKREKINVLEAPINVYEMHLGSWKRNENGEFLTYEQLSEILPKYLKDMGYTYVELMPLGEHPLDASWGYQGTGYYSPTSRYGDLNGLKRLIEKLHDEEIGVILDWVPGHFCKDSHGLYKFDGSSTYEYEEKWKSENCGWGTCNFDLGKSEVRSYLISNALYWIREFHIDGIRVDAVSSILYLDYGKQDGEWIPNEYGTNANLEGIEFLRQLNKAVQAEFTNILMIAEESTAWPNVSKSNSGESLGFNFKWNMGWMNDTLEYIKVDPIYRKFNHDKITFSMMYNYSENFILPISHDEVVHGKKSLVDKMWGDYWNKFSGLRLFSSYMIGHPGKKLLFMGCEFAQFVEWREYEQLQWFLIDQYDMHKQTKEFFKDLNHFYLENKALWELDYDEKGFNWIDADNNSQSILEFVRRSRNDEDTLIFISNFTPVVYYDYKIGVPFLGEYEEVFNTDNSKYGGSGQVMGEVLIGEKSEYHNQPYALKIKVPPMATLVLKIKKIYKDIEEKTFMKKVTDIAETNRDELLDKIEDLQ